MYRYDEFDAEFVAERVAQFRDQTARRLAGDLTEDQFKLHRLMNGVYLQLHAYMLRIAIPYGSLRGEADAHAGPCGAPLRSGIRAFHDPAEHPVQLAGALRLPRHPRRSRHGRDARHPDVGGTASAT